MGTLLLKTEISGEIQIIDTTVTVMEMLAMIIVITMIIITMIIITMIMIITMTIIMTIMVTETAMEVVMVVTEGEIEVIEGETVMVTVIVIMIFQIFVEIVLYYFY